MNLIERLNPLFYLNADDYSSLWQALFAGLLLGFWARLFAWCFLGLSIWFGIRRRNIQLGVIFFLIALAFTYGAPLFKLVGLII